MKRQLLKLIFLIPIIAWALSSCNHKKTDTGYAYMPDMYYSMASNAYSENPVLRDSMTNQMPVPGTIARGYMPYPYQPKNAESQKTAGEELINPVEVNKETLKEGKVVYETFCKN